MDCRTSLIGVAIAVCSLQANAQAPPARDLDSLRNVVANQDRQINDQQSEIDKLRASIEENKQLLQRAMALPGSLAPAVAKPPTPVAAAAPTAPASPGPAPTPPAQRDARNGGLPLNASQEVRFSDSSPTLKLGPADIRLQGYIALTGLYDTANVGGSIGTNFAAIPYSNTPEGNASEFRLSSQRTRVAVRVDTKLGPDPLSAYLEADFRGTTSGTVDVTSSSFGFRVRQAWMDYNRGKLEVSGGQMFSLITPVRTQISPNPGQANLTYAVDAQYLAGLVWSRTPAIRVAYHPNSATSFGVALENPEQQTVNGVKFPAALAPVLSTQYNTGVAELKTPNLGPDTVFKASFNKGEPGHQLHIDSGLILRFFRNYDPANLTAHKTATGVGGNVNLGLDLTPRLKMVLNGFLSSGGGRYIGGMVSDVVVRPNGDISPIKAHSWVSGFEFASSRRTMFNVYYSGVYASRNTTIDLNGSLVGFGYPGANTSIRTTNEWTVGWAHLFWTSESAGSIQLNTQYSYILNNPWAAGTGPRSAKANLVIGTLRYNLP